MSLTGTLLTAIIVGVVSFSIACYLGSGGKWPWTIFAERHRQRAARRRSTEDQGI